MSTLAEIRAAIMGKLASVSGVGRTHDYERFAQDLSGLIAHYQDGDRIRGWALQRVSTREVDYDIAEVRRLHTWRITGYLSLDDADATEKALDDTVEAICAAFRADRTLGGVVLDCKDLEDDRGPSGIQVDQMGPIMFAKVLCHRAQLRLVTETTETL